MPDARTIAFYDTAAEQRYDTLTDRGTPGALLT